jgi:hypothetical protein
MSWQVVMGRPPKELIKENERVKYGKKGQETVKKAMARIKKGKLESGKSGEKVKSRRQAIAIGLSESRKRGAKVPPRPKKK